ncbi:AzlD domain-containing protein [Carnobacterium divergens]|uniref:AzlD domain-containing protein n=1 Tax=Carnobacterium divergens TaxID=2748 RepID=A0AAW8R831_CARDV|nr:AzlD domain-containing protein [Carnobacterium divergens]ANZ98652.1 branched-chain amino acid transporter [Carnobacterium divergens]MDO0875542.1 AzlD domain-containing protein [Carnobacterium divergens]MDT1957252.1 AzlD domain-containing protein [Carnobacterium divergens]MDT1973222.1 AzlD domain-containing protein [Carnobacterium divergens]MDT1996239.1 AzlD domain-containing protein [Carnobacterium divergens]
MNSQFILLILGMAFVSYLPRVIPMMYFSKRDIPEWFHEWMKYVPAALFAALFFKDVFIVDGDFSLFSNLKIIAAVIVMAVAYKTKSMGLSVIGGLAAILLLTYAF